MSKDSDRFRLRLVPDDIHGCGNAAGQEPVQVALAEQLVGRQVIVDHRRRQDGVAVQAAAGGVGAMEVQLALRRGAVVSGTAGSDAKLERLRQLGVTHAINYRTHDIARELLRLSNGRRPDVIFDSIGGASARKVNVCLKGCQHVIWKSVLYAGCVSLR